MAWEAVLAPPLPSHLLENNWNYPVCVTETTKSQISATCNNL